VTIRHRSELDDVQREIREAKGVSALIYDQTCASEKRRRRKRGAYPDPAKRVVINEMVCEGCGDCSAASNCLSVEPLETEFGRKRQINQSTCNKDYSCVQGFCPSFVTVEGGQLKKPKKITKAEGGWTASDRAQALPAPAIATLTKPYGMLVTGIGGTGVVTVGQILAMAAHVAGKSCSVLDMSGLAQKGGPVMSHVRLAESDDHLFSTRVGTGAADLLIACDVLVAASKDALSRMGQGRTHAVVNATLAPTAAFVKNPDWVYPDAASVAVIGEACGADHVDALQAGRLATALMGDSIATNMFMLGYAWQRGWVPLPEAALLKAIVLNAVSVDFNLQSFAWGRIAAHDLKALEHEVNGLVPAQVIDFKRKESLDDLIRRRVEFLTAYQSARYADSYRDFVARVRANEGRVVAAGQPLRLTEAVARYLFKLMAYKDEYEVARLHSHSAFKARIANQFEGNYTIKYHLAPPLIAKRDSKGHLVKRQFGSWMRFAFPVLASLRFLRGTLLDPFGHTEERKSERDLIKDYRANISALCASLTAESLPQVIAIANIPEEIRGYGHVKKRHLRNAKEKEARLLEELRLGVRMVSRAA
jgi:indolepyruvate ferredoxin oxidoreductase